MPAAFAVADSIERKHAPFVADEAAEAAPVVEELHVADADSADVEALASGSEAPSGRPWLEFLMRPVSAGASEEEAVVEFELTVGNTGSVAARDVRISTWMFAAGSAQESEMEQLLIEPPAGASVSEAPIDRGSDSGRARIALPMLGTRRRYAGSRPMRVSPA